MDRELLLEVLEDLSPEQYEKVIFLLKDRSLNPPLSAKDTNNVSRLDLVTLLEQTYTDEVLRIIVTIMEKIKRMDLVDKLKKNTRDVGTGNICAQVQETITGDVVTEVGASSHSRQAGPYSKLVTDAQMMRVAKKMGRNWKQIGIEVLGIESHRLDQIEEENPNNAVMKIFHMLKAWKNQAKKGATAIRLHQLLSQDSVTSLDPEVYECLVD